MTDKLLRALVLSAMGMLIVSNLFAQDARVMSAAGDKYLISAKAGGVNFTEGRVAIARTDGRGGQLLKGDEVQIGEIVATGADGRAEILLNPGSYMRIDKETEFSFLSTSLDDLRIKLNSGSAVFEVIADDEFRVSVRMPKTHVELTRSGVYRLDVMADGTAKVSVWKGTAFVGGAKTEVKTGRVAAIDGTTAAVAKFDRGKKDVFDTWSEDRAKELTKVNAGLQRRTLRDTLLNSFNRRGGWNMYNSFGLWIFDARRSNWCFMPFGYGWGSPYGYAYNWDLWGLGMPNWIYYQPPVYNPPTAGNPGTKAPAILPPNNGDTHGRIRPPFTKIQESERGGVSGGVIVRGDPSVKGDSGQGPVFAPPRGTMPSGPPPSSSPVSQPVYSPPSISLPRGNPGKGKPDQK